MEFKEYGLTAQLSVSTGLNLYIGSSGLTGAGYYMGKNLEFDLFKITPLKFVLFNTHPAFIAANGFSLWLGAGYDIELGDLKISHCDSATTILGSPLGGGSFFSWVSAINGPPALGESCWEDAALSFSFDYYIPSTYQ